MHAAGWVCTVETARGQGFAHLPTVAGDDANAGNAAVIRALQKRVIAGGRRVDGSGRLLSGIYGNNRKRV